MIRITSLNKIYKSKKRKTCHAVKNINLTLPDSGLVFVLGKSGSGKSTLLNLIGGLDSISSGTIEVDGNDLSTFKEKDFCNYRNTHIGFIFQDYHLIDELTVYENIVLSLNLRRIEDKELVKAALEKVDLAGYEDRYPTELSGGEQQRVAIARAIVKNPRIILADEPTGNLDTHTAKAIVELLKELSKDCLILIVSHNVNDANSYADRIIELSKGKIISDKSRNPEFADRMTTEGDKLIYPKGLELSDEDIEFINKNLNVFVKRTDKFIDSHEPSGKSQKIKIENKSLSPRRELSLSGKFLKNKSLVISLSAFMVSVIMVIMALAQTIVQFDGSHIIADEMAKGGQSSILMNKVSDAETKAQLNMSYPAVVDESDIQAFYNSGYKGKIYPVLSHTLFVSNVGTAWGLTNTRFKGVYLAETFGTMVVDDDFLNRKFDDYEFLARVDKFQDCGVIITDYVADSIIMLNNKYFGKTYDQLLGEYYFSSFSLSQCYINGIIDTGYKDRYKDLFELINSGKSLNTNELYSNSDFQTLLNEVCTSLGFCYTTNPNFESDYLNTALSHYPPHYTLVFNDKAEYQETQNPYVINSTYQSNSLDTTHLLARDWMYTTTAPEIPEGAKYIRVAFNNMVDEKYGCTHEVATAECATLVFNNGNPVLLEIMNAYTRKDGGIMLDKYTGEIIDHDRGGKGGSQISEYIEIPENATITVFSSIALAGYPFCAFYDENKELISCVYAPKGRVLEEKTVYLNMNKYNEIFGTDYTTETADSFIPHTVTMTHYDYNDVDRKNPLFSVDITIAGFLVKDASRTMDVSQDIYELFAKDYVRVYSLYLDGTDGIGKALDVAGELNYEPQSVSIEGIHSMTRAVDVFVPIFELISIFLYIGVIFILMNFASKMINDKMHEIGILKALGTKNGSIGVVFGLQVGLIALLTCGLSTLGYYLFIDVANDILIESIRRIAPSWTLPDLQFLTFKPEIALMNCLLIFALAFVSLIFPMIKIKAIKPVKIIKAKE